MIGTHQAAPQLHTYALGRDGIVHDLVQAPGGTDWPTDIDTIDVTGQAPAPAIGWIMAAGAVSAPPPVVIPAVTSWSVSLTLVRERAQAAGRWDEFAAALETLTPAQRWHLQTLREGIANDDPDAVALLQAVGLDPAAILASPSAA